MKASEQVKELEQDNEFLKQENLSLKVEIESLKSKLKSYRDLCLMMIPEKVYTHQERRNTTVKFSDGSQQTVRRRAKEKDCIETAIAYCVLKQLLPSSELNKLIKEREEH